MSTMAYLRVSKDTQDVKNQRLAILEFARQEKIKVDHFMELSVSSRKSTGERKNDRLPPPSADTIVKICAALSVPPSDLLSITGKMPSPLRQRLSESPAALQFIQQAHDLELTEAEWRTLTDSLKRLRS